MEDDGVDALLGLPFFVAANLGRAKKAVHQPREHANFSTDNTAHIMAEARMDGVVNSLTANSSFYRKRTTDSTCAHRIRSNVARGYTVAYATVGTSDLVTLVATASASGSVTLPAISPASTA